ncbi:MOSC domain containing protein [Devosia sp. LC5]|uniref:MOSC domain-containing protein n=1 Tax=Devosia sp. LC5 TaxID=1502724 RepID=UPI0004E2DC8F|nr:MOSC domain-containing protein [Devosia sp. LC5]KFC71845.1 MOSC domain containing protein [Devosia sp. LC5]
MAQLLSINLGTAQHIPGYSPLTGIVKTAVSRASIERLGLAGDAICDRQHHGGSDQAIYVYFADDYLWWATELGQSIAPGTFGENLTIGGVEGREVAIGDRFSIGPALLEVTYHRTPCMTFAARMGDPGWVRRFHRANRPGAYCRVLSAGLVETGMNVGYEPYAGERVTVSELMSLDGVREIDPAFMRRALATPIRDRTRFKFETRLASLF